jgi:hypothetical protein
MHAAAETDKGERQSQLLLLLLGAIDLQLAMSLSIKHIMKERVGGIHFHQPHRAAQTHSHKIYQHVPKGVYRDLMIGYLHVCIGI